jgi:hypothetical protein
MPLDDEGEPEAVGAEKSPSKVGLFVLTLLAGMKGSLALSACALLLAGCYDSNNTRSLQQHTANATAAAKHSAGAICARRGRGSNAKRTS